MKKDKRNLSLLVAIIMAVSAFLLWSFEAQYFSPGSSWVSLYNWSPLMITGLAIGAFIFPFWLVFKPKQSNMVLAFLLLYIVSIIAFYMTVIGFSALHSKVGMFSTIPLLLPIALLLGAISITIITRYLLHKVVFWQACLNIVAIIGATIMGMLTSKVLDMDGTLFESILAGYPYFWIVLLMGINGILSVALVEKHQKTTTLDKALDHELLGLKNN